MHDCTPSEQQGRNDIAAPAIACMLHAVALLAGLDCLLLASGGSSGLLPHADDAALPHLQHKAGAKDVEFCM